MISLRGLNISYISHVMSTDVPGVRTQQANSIFDFEGFINDDEDINIQERETAIDPIWEKQQKKVFGLV